MAAKKYYAVKKGRKTGIFMDWDTCRAEVEAAVKRANEITGVITTYVIPRPEKDTEKMLKLSGMDKTR